VTSRGFRIRRWLDLGVGAVSVTGFALGLATWPVGAVGVLLLIEWVLEVRAGVTWTGERVVVQNRLRHYDVGGDEVERVDAVRGVGASPRLVLGNGRRISMVAFAAPLVPSLVDDCDRAFDLAQSLGVLYERG
jgi:hypothetical protein